MTTNKKTYQQLAKMAAQQDKNGDAAQAARFYRLAGEAAVAQYANEAAVEFLSLALSRTAEYQIGERFSLLLAREKVYAFQGDQPASLRDLANLEFLANTLKSDARRAQVAVRRAHHHLQTGQFDLAVSTAQNAARLAQLAANGHVEAEACLAWGVALIRQGSYDWAQTQLVQAINLAQSSSNRELIADCIRTIGLLYINQGDLTQSRFSYDQALVIYEEVGDVRGQSMTFNNLAHIAYNRKKFNEAQGYWNKALEAYEVIGDRPSLAMVSGNLGAMHMDVGDYQQAKASLEESLAISRNVQSLMGQSMALVNLALLHHYMDENKPAYEFGQSALELSRQMNNRRVQGYALIPMGHALLAMNKAAEAQDVYWQSLAIWHELDQPNLVIEQRAGLARAMMAQALNEEALEQVELILSFLKQNEGLEGVESDLKILFTCYQVLQAEQDSRASQILIKAHTRLEAQAAEIFDEEKRKSFLNNVPVSGQIIAAISKD